MTMALQILPKLTSIIANNPTREILSYLDENQTELNLNEAIAFHNFPLFREEEQLLYADIVLVSRNHGALLISTHTSNNSKSEIANIQESLEGSFNQVFSRLVKYPKLRRGRGTLLFGIDAQLWTAEESHNTPVETIVGFKALGEYINSKSLGKPIESNAYAELISVLDGSKALIRAKERNSEGFSEKTKISLIKNLEEEIRRFDRDQRLAYMTDVGGPQRIRGLAGSGKTVVLAMKAALTAIKHPEARIAVTFYTKSLYQHIKQLITRFYRLYEDRDPDWEQIQVLHAWGGATVNGLYYSATRAFGHPAISYTDASSKSRNQPFAFACADLLRNPSIGDLFDYVFVDEAQDFPKEFMQLALKLAREDKIVIAYDAFQTIYEVEPPTAASLFGSDDNGNPIVTFDEDIILHKCYRNPLEILVASHAIGFGIYSSKIVQMLESKEHWEDLGYVVETGEFKSGNPTSIMRPPENSPSSISQNQTIDQLLTIETFNGLQLETDWVVNNIVETIKKQGVDAEDILVISADDRNSAGYFRAISQKLLLQNIRCNNMQESSYSVRDFQNRGEVTLSTVYKAKGNEAYVVFLVGVDALFHQPTPKQRNKLFTAMTRAKGWLFISGVGVETSNLASEIKKSKRELPRLNFIYPSPDELTIMQRDLAVSAIELNENSLADLTKDLDDNAIDQLMRRLRQLKQRRSRSKKF